MVCRGKDNCCPGGILSGRGPECSVLQGERELTWIDVAGLFQAPQECLKAFIAVAAAEVLSGAKPANMVRIPNQKLPCGRRMYRLWQEFGAELLQNLPLSVRTLQIEKESTLLLFYRDDLLERRLSGRTMQTFLLRHGYPQKLTLEIALQHLQQSFNDGIPHEVGMFLGYPLKDVKGFMEQGAGPSHGRGMWRIYGPTSRSLKLNDFYRSKRRDVIARLAAGYLPQQLLQAA